MSSTGRSRRQMLCLHKQLHQRTYRHKSADRAGIDEVKTGVSSGRTNTVVGRTQETKYTSGGDTFRGNTRPHLEHDG